MKRDNYPSALVAAAIGFLIAFGAVGGLISGFVLTVDSMARFALLTLLVSALAACGFSLKRGSLWVFGGTVAAGVLLAVFTDMVQELAMLLCRLSYEYDLIYGWGHITFGQPLRFYVSYDRAAVVLAAVIAIAVTWTMCRRKKAFLAIGLSLLPLLACVVMTHTIPKQGYLLCLLTGLVLLMLTNTLRRQDPRGANMFTAIAAIPVAVLLCFLLYAYSPDEYQNRDDEWRDTVLSWFDGSASTVPNDAHSDPNAPDGAGTVGESHGTKTDLAKIGPRILSHKAIADVTCTVDGVLYLREQHYDTYTGTAWTIDEGDVKAFDSGAPQAAEQQTLSIATYSTWEKLLLPYYPISPTEIDSLWLFGGNAPNSDEQFLYTWKFTPLRDDWHESLERETGAVQGMNTPPHMPADTVAWAYPFVEEILSGDESTVTEVAETVAAYVKAHGEYDLNTRVMPDDETDFAQWFLTESDTGYCVHYATATAVLLRAAGIDARYVEGYACVVENGEAVVYADQAHAWVEYYETLLGMWIPLECTPSTPDSNVPVFTPPTSQTTSGDTQTTTVSDAADPTVPTKKDERPETPREPLSTAIAAGIVAAVVGIVCLAVLLQRRWRLRRREERLSRRAPNARALGIWQEIERCAPFTQLPRDEAVYALAQKAKFSQHTLTADELSVMRACYEKHLAVLKTHPWYKRLRYRWVLVIY